MSIVVGLSIAIACSAFLLGLLVGAGHKTQPTSTVVEPPCEWTTTFASMRHIHKLGQLLGDSIYARVAITTTRRNKHGTPHVAESEVEELCDVVLDHANAVIGQYRPAEAPQ